MVGSPNGRSAGKCDDDDDDDADDDDKNDSGGYVLYSTMSVK
jgi:hypothetical protein